MELKETLVRAELNEKQICELKQKLSYIECQLNESELHVHDLIVRAVDFVAFNI